MKKILFLLFILLAFIACSQDEDDTKEITLSVSTGTLSFIAGGEEKSFKIESNDSWIIDGIPDWCQLNAIKGENNKEILVKVDENLLEERRKATLKIISADKEKTIEISQNGKNITLSLSASLLTFEEFEEEKFIDIETNDTWTIASKPEWLILSKENGTGNETLGVKVSGFYEDREQSVVLEVKSGSKTEPLTVKQQGLVPTLVLSYPILNFYAEGGVKGIKIESNTKWTVTSPEGWCVPDKEAGRGNDELIITIPNYILQQSRVAEITIKAGNVERALYANQSGFINITDDPIQYNLKDHAFRPGDELVKKQVEYVDPGASGKNMLWDFRNLTVTNENYVISYTEPPVDTENGVYIMGDRKFSIKDTPANSLIVRTEHNTMYYYQIEDNYLHAHGHENPVTFLMYEPHMIMGKYPTYYGDTYKFNYKSKILYSGTISTQTEGYLEMNASAYGAIILPCGTLQDAFRVTLVQLIKDIPNDYMIDPNDNEKLYTINFWYVKGYRYPVFETHENFNVYTNTRIFETAFYFPPENHTYQSKTKSASIRILDNEEIKKKLEKYRFKK